MKNKIYDFDEDQFDWENCVTESEQNDTDFHETIDSHVDNESGD